MADIDEPTAGTAILDTWGVAVAQKLNRMKVLTLTSDESTNSATLEDIEDLSFEVVSGRYYTVYLFGAYNVNATNQGLQLGFDAPAGDGYLTMKISGNGAPNTDTRARTSGAAAGSTATDSTNNREWWAWLWLQPTANGIVTIQLARGGTSGAPGVKILAGAGGMALESGGMPPEPPT